MGMFFWVKKVVPALIVAADGSGDFTSIQAAIDALPDTGGEVFVKAGTYTITATIERAINDVSIIGTGKSTKIQTTSNVVMIELDTVSGWRLKDLYFYGAGAVNPANVGIHLTTTTDSLVEGCLVENCGNSGILLDTASNDNNIRNNHCNSNQAVGIFVVSSNSHVSGNEASTNDTGIYIFGASGNTIQRNKCPSNTNEGITIDDESDENTILGNICLSNGRDGIRVDDDCDNNVITGNEFNSNTGYGVNIITADCDTNTVTSNRLRNNTAGALNDDGTGTQIGHNVTA